jgi:hypothetical protein
MVALPTFFDPLRRFRQWCALPPAARAAQRRERNIGSGTDHGIASSVRATIAWLKRAQDCSSTNDGGVARHFSLVDGWGPSYPETTGYIVPTLIAFARRSGLFDERPLATRTGTTQHLAAKENGGADGDAGAAMLERTERMLDWLVSIQLPDGGFQGGTVGVMPVSPVVFNTCQVLLGLAAGGEQFGARYLTALNRAATWVVEVQDADGAWRKHESPFARRGEKSYHTHAAWGLFEAARVSGAAAYAEAALRNVRWALGKQRRNGWFEDCCVNDPKRPLTHTLGYALRGTLEAYRHTRVPKFLEAATRAGDGILAALRRDGFLPGRLDANWRGTVDWSCLTGTCQIAHCWLLLFRETNDVRFLSAARLANKYVRGRLDIDGSPDVRGAVRGSFPISGAYNRFQYPNWAAKFFIDVNLFEQEVCESTA